MAIYSTRKDNQVPSLGAGRGGNARWVRLTHLLCRSDWAPIHGDTVVLSKETDGQLGALVVEPVRAHSSARIARVLVYAVALGGLPAVRSERIAAAGGAVVGFVGRLEWPVGLEVLPVSGARERSHDQEGDCLEHLVWQGERARCWEMSAV